MSVSLKEKCLHSPPHCGQPNNTIYSSMCMQYTCAYQYLLIIMVNKNDNTHIDCKQNSLHMVVHHDHVYYVCLKRDTLLVELTTETLCIANSDIILHRLQSTNFST